MAFSETLIMTAANAAPRGVQWLIRAAAMNRPVQGLARVVTQRTLGRVRKLERIGVVSDTNIGDAVVLQGACSAFKAWLPQCEIDYFYQAKAEPLLRNNPNIQGHHPVFTDADFTSASNRRAIQTAILQRQYDLILNLYPFLMNSELSGARCPVLVPYGLITAILQAEKDANGIAHVSLQLRRFVDGIAQQLTKGHPPAVPQANAANLIYLSPKVPEEAAEMLCQVGVDPDGALAFVNTDSSSRFSRIPLEIQAELVRGVLELNRFDHVLIGPAYSFPDGPEQLCAKLASHPLSRKLVRLPQHIPIDTYAGVIDRAELFITSDTAQMHLGAGRRVSAGGNCKFRNKTTLLTVFGATNSRIYGYDSARPGYLGSSQDAPATIFEGSPPCKNLTCIHKTHKNCPTVECFTGLDMNRIRDWLRDWNSNTKGRAKAAASAELTLAGHPTERNSHAHILTSPDSPQPIIVVSGLPRSGTSLMMQMLAAGGVQIATDGIRAADEDNPHGYYELERVKLLDRDASWLRECKGKAVKIISMLLPSLPGHQEYRIIFMERDLPEVLASQKRMQQRRGTVDPTEDDSQLTAVFQQHLASVKKQLANRPNTTTLYVPYQSVVSSPSQLASLVRDFLELELDTERMVKAVDTRLYRHRLPAAQAGPR